MPREVAEIGHIEVFPQPHRWVVLAELARRQHGVVSLAQLVDLGFTIGAINSLAQRSRLHRVHRGVYALGPAALTANGNRMAAVLACGPGSVLAGRSAGAQIGLIVNSSPRIDVITARQVRRSGIRSRRIGGLLDRDRAEFDGIPCTSVARTLLDISARGLHGEIRKALERAEELRLFDLAALDDVLARNAGRRGARRLRTAVEALRDESPFRSEFERRLMPIFRAAGLRDPLINHLIHLPGGSIEVDFHWPALRLVVEVDGYRFHGNRHGFRNDRRRDRRLAAAGILCLRYVWEDLLDDQAGLIAELRRTARVQKSAISADFCKLADGGTEPRPDFAAAARRPPRRADRPGRGRSSTGT